DASQELLRHPGGRHRRADRRPRGRDRARLGLRVVLGDPMHDVQHISVYIARPPAEVYGFASDPRNLTRWAAGLARSGVRRDGDGWVVDAPFGKVRVKFAPRNSLGVMDHDVRLASGVTVHNPMRVVPNGAGSELVFTLIRRPRMSARQFARDK